MVKSESYSEPDEPQPIVVQPLTEPDINPQLLTEPGRTSTEAALARSGDKKTGKPHKRKVSKGPRENDETFHERDSQWGVKAYKGKETFSFDDFIQECLVKSC